MHTLATSILPRQADALFQLLHGHRRPQEAMVDHLGDVMKCVLHTGSASEAIAGKCKTIWSRFDPARYPNSISSSFAGTIPFSSMTTISPKRKIAMKTTALEKAQMNP